MSAEQQKCCAVQQPPLMDFLLTYKKILMTSLRYRSPGSAHVLSAFLPDLKRSAACRDGRSKFSTRACRSLSSTLLYTHAADRMRFHLSRPFNHSEQINFERPYSLKKPRRKSESPTVKGTSVLCMQNTCNEYIIRGLWMFISMAGSGHVRWNSFFQIKIATTDRFLTFIWYWGDLDKSLTSQYFLPLGFSKWGLIYISTPSWWAPEGLWVTSGKASDTWDMVFSASPSGSQWAPASDSTSTSPSPLPPAITRSSVSPSTSKV